MSVYQATCKKLAIVPMRRRRESSITYSVGICLTHADIPCHYFFAAEFRSFSTRKLRMCRRWPTVTGGGVLIAVCHRDINGAIFDIAHGDVGYVDIFSMAPSTSSTARPRQSRNVQLEKVMFLNVYAIYVRWQGKKRLGQLCAQDRFRLNFLRQLHPIHARRRRWAPDWLRLRQWHHWGGCRFQCCGHFAG